MKIKKLKISSNIHPDNYVNIHTGETLSSESSDKVSLVIREATEEFIMSSKNYVVFDNNAVMYLTNHLSTTERARIFSIANMVRTNCSVVYQNNNHPHTPETLCTVLDMNLNKFYEFIRKLVKKNILCYAVCSPSGYVQKIYILNPYIARKTNKFNCELTTMFRDVTKDGQLLD